MKNIEIIRIINILIGEDVEYEIRSESLIFLNIFDELLEIHSDTEQGEYFAENPYKLKTIKEIFNYILIRTILIKGWLPEHLLLFGTVKNLRRENQYHLGRLSESRSLTSDKLFRELNLIEGSPQEAQEKINKKFPVTKIWNSIPEKELLLEISHKLVKAIRAKNRKIIISKIMKEVLNSKE